MQCSSHYTIRKTIIDIHLLSNKHNLRFSLQTSLCHCLIMDLKLDDAKTSKTFKTKLAKLNISGDLIL